MPKTVKTFLFFTLIIVFVFSYYQNPISYINSKFELSDNTESDQVYYPVQKVIDGDTIAVEVSGEEKRIRILGINTPESVDPERPVECYGIEASLYLKQLLTGSKVKIHYDNAKPRIDDYGRILAYIESPSQADIGTIMIEKGYAYEYTYHNEWYSKQKIYKNLEKNAKNSLLGLWEACSNP